MSDPCVFCDIVAGTAPAAILADSLTALIFRPLEPHAPGHALVIPKRHVEDASTDPELTGQMFRHAAIFLDKRQGNILTSVGPLATQTVRHLHIHVIPRGVQDGLHDDWPWLRDLFRVRHG